VARILVACEFSGAVREAFRNLGFEAYSCDILPADPLSPYHIQRDVRDLFKQQWDLVIFHPPCTYLCNSGVRWLYTDPTRWEKMVAGAEFFKLFLNLEDVPRVCIENPIMHKHAKAIIWGDNYQQPQIIQPWMFGHGETKATCLWLKGLPPLVPTDIVSGRDNRIHRMSPGKNRGHLRSITYSGIAKAMAEQWGALLCQSTSTPESPPSSNIFTASRWTTKLRQD
jgi:hypothetical protein